MKSLDTIQALQAVNHGRLAKLIADHEAQLGRVRYILLISPHWDDCRFIRSLFPQAHVYSSHEHNWDLNNPVPDLFPTFDLVVASNVLMYSSAPATWIANLLQCTRNLIIQDLKYRKRSGKPPHLGVDGDTIRYAMRNGTPPVQPTFFLDDLPDTPQGYLEFAGVANQYHSIDDSAVHVCMMFENPDTSKNDRRITLSFSCRHRFWVNYCLTKAGRFAARILKRSS